MKEKTIKTALNDISSDLSTLATDVKSMSEQLPTLAATREEVNSFKLLVENYNQKLDTALVVIQRGVDVRLGPIKLSETHYNALDDINTNLKIKNQRWSSLCKAIASTGKIKVIATAFVSALITAAFLLLAYENSPHVWAHRALVAAEESHMEKPLDEYAKAFVEMSGGIKARKDCKDRIVGMESKANKIKTLEDVLSDYTEEVVEVREYKVNLKADPIVDLICNHPSSNQKVNYRIHSTPEGKVTKVEIEKKVKKGSVRWTELKPIAVE
jgi:hypothetical protein